MNTDLVKINDPEWMSNIDFVQYEKLAAIGYQPEKIAMYFKIPREEFMFYYMLENSVLKYHYDCGILFYQAKAGIGMLDGSENSATQAQRLDKLRNEIDFRNAIDEIIYGGI